MLFQVTEQELQTLWNCVYHLRRNHFDAEVVNLSDTIVKKLPAHLKDLENALKIQNTRKESTRDLKLRADEWAQLPVHHLEDKE